FPVQPSVPVTVPAPTKPGLQVFNPEIGMLADVTANLSESTSDAEGNDKINLRELELIIGHPVDPYSRFDSTITFSDFESPSIEEAYITHWGLPWEMKGKIGRIRPKIGKASAVHRDQLETTDDPLVVQSYLGAEGLSRSAVEVSKLFELPWGSSTHEFTTGIMEGGVGEGGTLFSTTRRRPSFYSHLKNYWDLSDETNFELGGTYLLGSKDSDTKPEVNAIGLDTTLVHYVTPTNKLKWQNELYWQDRDESFSVDADTSKRTEFKNNPWGVYSLLDYRLSPRLGIGTRFDYVEPVDAVLTNARDADIGVTGYLTLYQSEFARWRVQYQHVEYAARKNDERVFLQGTVAIGVHKHQLQ
ncbi:MAG: hypothetical protein HYS56_02265, partial [Candidatus Omnitrophica bacterium]|nr:hypothetical protein [Candidatus Omnitrophota bacterium]